MLPRHTLNKRLPLLSAGGPGHEASRPIEASGWLKVATATHRVFLLDQRGTGRSSRITVDNLPLRGTPQQQADYLQHFRYHAAPSVNPFSAEGSLLHDLWVSSA